MSSSSRSRGSASSSGLGSDSSTSSSSHSSRSRSPPSGPGSPVSPSGASPRNARGGGGNSRGLPGRAAQDKLQHDLRTSGKDRSEDDRGGPRAGRVLEDDEGEVQNGPAGGRERGAKDRVEHGRDGGRRDRSEENRRGSRDRLQEGRDRGRRDRSEENRDRGRRDRSEEGRDRGRRDRSVEDRDRGRRDRSEEGRDRGRRDRSEQRRDRGRRDRSEEGRERGRGNKSEEGRDTGRRDRSEHGRDRGERDGSPGQRHTAYGRDGHRLRSAIREGDRDDDDDERRGSVRHEGGRTVGGRERSREEPRYTQQHRDERERADRRGRDDRHDPRGWAGRKGDDGGQNEREPREHRVAKGDYANRRGPSPAAGSKRRRSLSPDDEHHLRQDRRLGQRSPSPSPRGPPGRLPVGRGHPARENLSALPPDVNSIHPGVVQAVKPFGIFVQLEGYQRHCLVHHSQVSQDIQLSKSDEDDMKIKALEYAAPVGSKVWVKVTEVTGEGASFKVHGSMKSVSQEDGADLDPEGRMVKNPANWTDEPPEVGSVHRAVVKRIEPYGVFVQLDGFKRFGLVHTSQVSNFLEFSREDTDEEKVAGLGGVVAVNDVVFVKVVEVQEGEGGRGPRIGCSIKLVNQTDGVDLDPHGLRYKPRDAGGGGGPGGRGAPIGADAGAVGRSGVINWGYTKASDVRVAPGGKEQYSLLEDEAPGAGQRSVGDQGGVVAPAGRGRGSVLPAWMTGAGQSGIIPGGEELPPPPPLPTSGAAINSVEEALAILQKYGAGKKAKKEKKKSKKSKEKHKKEKTSRKEKKVKSKHKKEKKERKGKD